MSEVCRWAIVHSRLDLTQLSHAHTEKEGGAGAEIEAHLLFLCVHEVSSRPTFFVMFYLLQSLMYCSLQLQN